MNFCSDCKHYKEFYPGCDTQCKLGKPQKYKMPDALDIELGTWGTYPVDEGCHEAKVKKSESH